MFRYASWYGQDPNRSFQAASRRARRKGLLGRAGLAPFSALVLAPCPAVHTLFMRFAIDVLFVDRDGRVVHIVQALAPWRAAMSSSAHAAIELPAGTLESRDVAVGDSLYLAEGGNRLCWRTSNLRDRPC